MKACTVRGVAVWAVVTAAIALMLQGCGATRSFMIRKQQVVASVNAQGQPGPSTTQFTTTDSAAYCWFEYRNAPASKSLKCEVKYTDPDGQAETRDATVALRPGNHKVHFGVEVPREEGLKPGTYECQVYDGEAALFGTPLRFAVAGSPSEAADTAPVIQLAPVRREPLEPTPPERGTTEGTGEKPVGEKPAGEKPAVEKPAAGEEGVSEIETTEANVNPFR